MRQLQSTLLMQLCEQRQTRSPYQFLLTCKMLDYQPCDCRKITRATRVPRLQAPTLPPGPVEGNEVRHRSGCRREPPIYFSRTATTRARRRRARGGQRNSHHERFESEYEKKTRRASHQRPPCFGPPGPEPLLASPCHGYALNRAVPGELPRSATCGRTQG